MARMVLDIGMLITQKYHVRTVRVIGLAQTENSTAFSAEECHPEHVESK